MKKTFIKILSVVLCAVMVLGAAPLGGLVGLDLPSLFDFKAEAESYSGECGDNLTWSLDTETGVLNITGTGEMYNWSASISVPWDLYRSYIKTVNISNSVTNIGCWAFYKCNNLTSVTIGNSVTAIGICAFSGCLSLESITIPDSVTYIGVSAFSVCKALVNVTFGDSIRIIDDSAFEKCHKLPNVTIPNSVIIIGESAFEDCIKLTSVKIGSNVTEIETDAFRYCISLVEIEVDDENEYYSNDNYGVLFNKDKTELIQYPIGNERKSYVIPYGVTNIRYYSFYRCHSLTSVTIPDSVITIGAGVFNNCINITNLKIPNNVTIIGGSAFCCCKGLKKLVIPDSVEILGYESFRECANLKSVVIGNGVTEIYYGAFMSCSDLEYIHIPVGVTSIGEKCFYGNSLYICSTSNDCYAKTYADANGIEFRLCNGDHTYENLDIELKIKQPNVTAINYGETLVLQLEDVEVPEGYRIEWSIIGDAVTISVSEDGKECRVTSTASGNVSVTATLVDENGEPELNELGNNIESFINISSKAGFWQKLISFFKNLFRVNRIIY